jgi:hypothetical protein
VRASAAFGWPWLIFSIEASPIGRALATVAETLLVPPDRSLRLRAPPSLAGE